MGLLRLWWRFDMFWVMYTKNYDLWHWWSNLMLWFMFKPWVTVNSLNISMYRILFHRPGHEKQQSLRYLTVKLPYLGTGLGGCFSKLCQATVALFQQVVVSEFSLPLFHLSTNRVFLAIKIKKSSLHWLLLLQLIRPSYEWLEGKCHEVVMIML